MDKPFSTRPSRSFIGHIHSLRILGGLWHNIANIAASSLQASDRYRYSFIDTDVAGRKFHHNLLHASASTCVHTI